MFDEKVMRMPGWRGGDGNAAYLDKTLRHGVMELSLDDRIGWKVILHLWLRALVAFVLILLPFLLLGGLPAFGGSVDALMTGSAAGFVVFWLVLLLPKYPEPVSEWRVLLDDRTDLADSVYSKIVGTLARRRIPVAVVKCRIRTGLGPEQVSSRLLLREDSYVAYVSVFGYGTSLCLGWMMWRSRRGFELIKQFVVDLVAAVLGRDDPELLMLRTERPRAMREAVHAACREGLVVAIDRTEVPVSFGFPHGLPRIEDRGLTTTATPVPPVPSAPPQPPSPPVTPSPPLAVPPPSEPPHAS